MSRVDLEGGAYVVVNGQSTAVFKRIYDHMHSGGDDADFIHLLSSNGCSAFVKTAAVTAVWQFAEPPPRKSCSCGPNEACDKCGGKHHDVQG